MRGGAGRPQGIAPTIHEGLVRDDKRRNDCETLFDNTSKVSETSYMVGATLAVALGIMLVREETLFDNTSKVSETSYMVGATLAVALGIMPVREETLFDHIRSMVGATLAVALGGNCKSSEYLR